MSEEGESGASNDFFHKWPPLFGKKPATNTTDSAIAANTGEGGTQGHTCCVGGCENFNTDSGNTFVAKSGSVGSTIANKQATNVQANVSNAATSYNQNNYGSGGPSQRQNNTVTSPGAPPMNNYYKRQYP